MTGSRASRTVAPVLALGLALVGAAVPAGRVQAQASPASPPDTSAVRGAEEFAQRAERAVREAEREALKAEIERYTRMVQAMRESLAVRDAGDVRQREIERTIAELSTAVGAITDQLAELEVEVVDNEVSLRDGRGGRVTVEIPEDLPQRLSEGLSSVTRMFLEEMPDTVRLGDRETGFTWNMGEGGLQFRPVAPPSPRRVIEGGLVKIHDHLAVAADEDVHGDAVAVMGDASVAGRVRGDVVVVLGDVHLDADAVVDGRVIAVLGRIDRDDGAQTGAVTVVNPGGAALPSDLSPGGVGWLSFGAYQSFFAILLVMALLLLALTPTHRREALMALGRQRPGQCVALGLMLAVVGHVVLLGLVAILVLTVIGIPVALLALLALALVDLAGVAIGSLVLGRALCIRWGLECPRPWRELALGMALIHLPAFFSALLAALSVPVGLAGLLAVIGALTKLTAFCLGLGALFLGRLGSRPAASLPGEALTPAPGSTPS